MTHLSLLGLELHRGGVRHTCLTICLHSFLFFLTTIWEPDVVGFLLPAGPKDFFFFISWQDDFRGTSFMEKNNTQGTVIPGTHYLI